MKYERKEKERESEKKINIKYLQIPCVKTRGRKKYCIRQKVHVHQERSQLCLSFFTLHSLYEISPIASPKSLLLKFTPL